jgi:hypothetical protein
MSLQQQELNSVIPDLRNRSLERLGELGDSALALDRAVPSAAQGKMKV